MRPFAQRPTSQGRKDGRIKAAFIGFTLVAGILALDAPMASAHGSCVLSGGYESFANPPGPISVTGTAELKCDGSHRRSEAWTKLQIYKNGSWKLIAESNNPASQCCDRKAYIVFTKYGYCLPGYGTYTWRVYVKYWRLWNSNNTIAHQRSDQTARTWTMDCLA